SMFMSGVASAHNISNDASNLVKTAHKVKQPDADDINWEREHALFINEQDLADLEQEVPPLPTKEMLVAEKLLNALLNLKYSKIDYFDLNQTQTALNDLKKTEQLLNVALQKANLKERPALARLQDAFVAANLEDKLTSDVCDKRALKETYESLLQQFDETIQTMS
ncbi:MAG: hypothetical protein R3240_13350, partial [Gammaproteobacteria bacterium]|nr:hypothetical protein [Gammaproteobacteria bacterium]